MEQKETLKEIINFILEGKNIPKIESLEDDLLLRDIGLDSFDLAELTVRIEDKYDIDIFEDGIVSTVGEIISKLS